MISIKAALVIMAVVKNAIQITEIYQPYLTKNRFIIYFTCSSSYISLHAAVTERWNKKHIVLELFRHGPKFLSAFKINICLHFMKIVVHTLCKACWEMVCV